MPGCKLDLPFGSGFKHSILAPKTAPIFSASLEAMLINTNIKEKRGYRSEKNLDAISNGEGLMV